MKWEYKTIKISKESNLLKDTPGFETKELDNFINKFGDEGWELVSVEGIINSDNMMYQVSSVNTTTVVMFFKRPLAE